MDCQLKIALVGLETWFTSWAWRLGYFMKGKSGNRRETGILTGGGHHPSFGHLAQDCAEKEGLHQACQCLPPEFILRERIVSFLSPASYPKLRFLCLLLEPCLACLWQFRLKITSQGQIINTAQHPSMRMQTSWTFYLYFCPIMLPSIREFSMSLYFKFLMGMAFLRGKNHLLISSGWKILIISGFF